MFVSKSTENVVNKILYNQCLISKKISENSFVTGCDPNDICYENGYVGIGVCDPQRKLHINVNDQKDLCFSDSFINVYPTDGLLITTDDCNNQINLSTRISNCAGLTVEHGLAYDSMLCDNNQLTCFDSTNHQSAYAYFNTASYNFITHVDDDITKNVLSITRDFITTPVTISASNGIIASQTCAEPHNISIRALSEVGSLSTSHGGHTYFASDGYNKSLTVDSSDFTVGAYNFGFGDCVKINVCMHSGCADEFSESLMKPKDLSVGTAGIVFTGMEADVGINSNLDVAVGVLGATTRGMKSRFGQEDVKGLLKLKDTTPYIGGLFVSRKRLATDDTNNRRLECIDMTESNEDCTPVYNPDLNGVETPKCEYALVSCGTTVIKGNLVVIGNIRVVDPCCENVEEVLKEICEMEATTECGGMIITPNCPSATDGGAGGDGDPIIPPTPSPSATNGGGAGGDGDPIIPPIFTPTLTPEISPEEMEFPV